MLLTLGIESEVGMHVSQGAAINSECLIGSPRLNAVHCSLVTDDGYRRECTASVQRHDRQLLTVASIDLCPTRVTESRLMPKARPRHAPTSGVRHSSQRTC